MAKTAFDQLVRVRAKPGREADTRRLLEALVAHARAEDGPVAYDLFQSEADPASFAIDEGWDSRDALDRHGTSAYLKDTVARLADLVAERDPDGKPFVGEPLSMLSERGTAP